MNSMLRLVLVLTLITAGAGLILSLVESVTREPIAEQRRLATLRALKAVLPPANNSPDGDTVRLITGQDKRGRDVARTFFRGRQDGPGLGDKITLPVFKGIFVGKNLDNADWRVKKDGGEFDQITGATISPRAVVGAVSNGLEFFREHGTEILANAEGGGP